MTLLLIAVHALLLILGVLKAIDLLIAAAIHLMVAADRRRARRAELPAWRRFPSSGVVGSDDWLIDRDTRGDRP